MEETKLQRVCRSFFNQLVDNLSAQGYSQMFQVSFLDKFICGFQDGISSIDTLPVKYVELLDFETHLQHISQRDFALEEIYNLYYCVGRVAAEYEFLQDEILASKSKLK